MYSKNSEIDYDCKFDWGSDSLIKVRQSDINFIQNKTLKCKQDKENKYLFAVNLNIPDSLDMADIFVMDKWQKPRIWVTGRASCPEKAEANAVRNLEKIKSCNHHFKNESNNDLIGDASCLHCNLFVPEYFLNNDIKKAKYNALAYHKNDMFIDGIELKNHLYSVVTEMNFDINLKDHEKIDLICAGWLHHTNGNIEANDFVEKILKYFYLEPSIMHESLILQYYDLVDTMKILIHSQTDMDKLCKVNALAKSLVQHFEDKSMPNATFLQSWILMADQTILTKSI